MFTILLSVLLVLLFPFEVIGIKPTEYTGTLNTTIFGKPCQYWNSDKPHAHDYHSYPKNYCRNPSKSKYIWCYTSDPDVRWDICDPRTLTELPYKTVLFNTTGPTCLTTECCNATWKSFRDVHFKCDPAMFVRLPIFYRLPKNLATTDTVYFVKKYVVTKFFTIFLNTDVRSPLDCAAKCLDKSESECNGFYHSENITSYKDCLLGKFNSPDGLKTLSVI